MNIAVLIGISTYKNASSLTACEHDVDNMRRLLDSTRKYDDILTIKDNTSSNHVKESLRSFFGKYQNNSNIEEAFVYFSGHGIYVNDALLCCSDFDTSKPSTTSLSNSELDDLLRSISPDVAVKIIDACQSGSPYIKAVDGSFEKSFKTSPLKSFICMTSSQQDQSSFATATESLFTSKWIDAALAKDDGVVLYRDIQAALADEFVQHPDQTPFFVNQGSGLEAFSAITIEMKTLLTLRSKSPITPEPEDSILKVLNEEIQKRDAMFIPKDRVTAVIETSKELISKYAIKDRIVSKLYTSTISVDTRLSSIPKASEVAKFAEDQSWQKKYFVQIKTEKFRTRVPKEPLSLMSRLSGLGANMDDSEFVTVTRERPSSIESTESLPLEVAVVSFISDHSSLPGFRVYIGLVHSLTEVMILSTTAKVFQSGWESRSINPSDIKWRFQNYTWAELSKDPSILFETTMSRAEEEIRKTLESFLPKPEPTEEQAASGAK